MRFQVIAGVLLLNIGTGLLAAAASCDGDAPAAQVPAEHDSPAAEPQPAEYGVKYAGGWWHGPIKRNSSLTLEICEDTLVLTASKEQEAVTIPLPAITLIEGQSVAIKHLFSKWNEIWLEAMQQWTGDARELVGIVTIWSVGSAILLPTRFGPDRKYFLLIEWEDDATTRDLLLRADNRIDYFLLQEDLRRARASLAAHDNMAPGEKGPDLVLAEPWWGSHPTLGHDPCPAMPASLDVLFLPKDDWLLEFTPPAEAGAAEFEPPLPRQEVSPIFPAFVRTLNLDGSVVLEAVVRDDGQVTDVEVVDGVYWVVDDNIALTFEQWNFEPARVGDQPVDAPVMVSVAFRPQSAGRLGGSYTCAQLGHAQN